MSVLKVTLKNRAPLVNRRVISMVGVLFFLVLLELTGWARPVRARGELLLQPAWNAAAGVWYAIQWPVRLVGQTAVLQRRVVALQLAANEAAAQTVELQALQAENAALRAALQNTDRSLEKRVVAAPIVAYGTPYINQGAEAGVSSGLLVLVGQTLIGKIGAVSPHQAEVILLTSAEAPPVLARTASGVSGLIRGDGKQLFLTELPAQASIQEGELIVTAGQAGIEADVFVGKVQSVERQPTSATARVVVDQGVSFYDVRVAEVRLP